MHNSKIPKEIKVGSFVYKIKRMPNLVHNDKECWGLCLPSIFEIHLDSKAPLERIKIILMHELLHAICDYYHVEDINNEEKFCTDFAIYLNILFAQNPKLAELYR